MKLTKISRIYVEKFGCKEQFAKGCAWNELNNRAWNLANKHEENVGKFMLAMRLEKFADDMKKVHLYRNIREVN